MATGFTPIYRIMKDGADITDHFNDRTTDIRVDLASGNGQPDTFRITVDDRDFIVASPNVGAVLQIYLGYEEIGMAYMGMYEISEVYYEGMPKQIRLVGQGVGMDSAIKSQVYASYDGKTVGDILGEIARKAGVGLKIHGDLASKKIPFKNQTAISGFHLMHELERHFDAVAKFADGNLVFVPRDEGDSVTGAPLNAVLLHPHHFGTWSVKHTQRPEYSSVKTRWWDKENNKTVWEDAPVPGAEIGSLPYRVGRTFNSKEEAIEFGKSRSHALRRSQAEARVELAKGDPWIRDQMPLVIRGMRDGVDGSYIIDTVSHAYRKETGITTSILAKPPGDGDTFGDQLVGEENPNGTGTIVQRNRTPADRPTPEEGAAQPPPAP